MLQYYCGVHSVRVFRLLLGNLFLIYQLSIRIKNVLNKQQEKKMYSILSVIRQISDQRTAELMKKLE